MSGRFVWCIEQIVWEPSIVTDETEMGFNLFAEEYIKNWEYYGNSLDGAFDEFFALINGGLHENYTYKAIELKMNFLRAQTINMDTLEIEDYSLYIDETAAKSVSDILGSAIQKFVFACYDLSTSNDEGYCNRTIWHIDNKPDAKGYQGFVETTYKATDKVSKKLNVSKFVSKKKGL